MQLLRVAGSHEAEENINVNKLSNILKALTASEVHLEESAQRYSVKDRHWHSKEHDWLISSITITGSLRHLLVTARHINADVQRGTEHFSHLHYTNPPVCEQTLLIYVKFSVCLAACYRYKFHSK